MLSLHIEQHHWVLQTERDRLAQALDQALPDLWPQLAQQLGPRASAFVRASLQYAWQHGFESHRHAVKLFNLWCIWGPAFESKPGFEWALEILSDEQRHPAVKVQQLSMQTRTRLQEAGLSIKPADWDRTDVSLADLVTKPTAISWIEQASAGDEPRVLCDFQLFEVALANQSWRKEYKIDATPAGDLVAQHGVYEPARQQQRIERARQNQTLTQMHVLAYPISDGVKSVLHVRGDMAHVCHPQQHPRMTWVHATGVDVQCGEAVQRRPLYSSVQAWAKPGAVVPGLAFAPQPNDLTFKAESCGLRLAGAPIREHALQLTVWPAEQWLAEVRNRPQPEMSWPSADGDASSVSADVLLAVDGRVLPTPVWTQAWAKLVPAMRAGLDQWMRNFERAAALERLKCTLQPNLMHGRSMMTWGMRESVDPQGGSSTAFVRVQGEGRWTACASDLLVQGDLSQGGAVARLRLRSVGEAIFDTKLKLEAPDVGIAQVFAGLKVSWRHPFVAELEAMSSPSLKTLSLDGEQSLGALFGEAGLRPRADGQGYEWYCQVKLEAARVHYTVWDPLLGPQRCQRALWEPSTLLEWSAG